MIEDIVHCHSLIKGPQMSFFLSLVLGKNVSLNNQFFFPRDLLSVSNLRAKFYEPVSLCIFPG